MKIDESFLTYVDNVFIKILHAIMLDKLDEVDHFIGDDLFNELKEKVTDLKKNNLIQMYEMTNVKKSYINKEYKKDGKYIVEVDIIARYVEYIMDAFSNRIVSGNSKDRVECEYKLMFERSINALDKPKAYICPHCGSSMDINNSGKCSYCGGIFNLEDFYFILVRMEK